VRHGYGVEVNVLLPGHVLDRCHTGQHLGGGNFSDRTRFLFFLFSISTISTHILSVVLLVSKEILTARKMSLKHKHNGQEHLRSIFHVNTLEFIERETLLASVNFVQEDLDFLLGLDTI
jgi:hypothetical protein